MEDGGKGSGEGAAARPYRSPRRAEQAERTRRRILESARVEFLSSGYAGTTMAAVAARAQVSPATVDKVFGTKPGLLKLVTDVAIAGDDEPLPVLARTPAAEAEAAATVEDFLLRASGILAAGQQRSARLVLVAFEAAAADPALRPFVHRRLDQRHSVAAWVVDGILSRAPLRPEVDRAYAVDTVWVLMDPAVYCRLTEDRSWSGEQYQRWFADSVQRLLVDDAAH